jgi:hypothetical protein
MDKIIRRYQMRPNAIKVLLLHLFLAFMILFPAFSDNTLHASSAAGDKMAMSKTFPSKESADRFADKLKSEGFDVDIREVTSKNKDTFYRVSGKRDPESLKDALSSSGAGHDEKLSPDKSTAPGSLVILSPRERSEFRNVNKITFLWSRVPQAARYHVIIAKDRTFTSVVQEDQNVTIPTYTIEGLNYGTYFLKVRSRLSNNAEGPSSKTLSFIIVPPQPSTEPLILLESGK